MLYTTHLAIWGPNHQVHTKALANRLLWMFLGWSWGCQDSILLHAVPQWLPGHRQGVVFCCLSPNPANLWWQRVWRCALCWVPGLTLTLQPSSVFPWMGPASWAAPLAPRSLQWSLSTSAQLALLSHSKKASWCLSSDYSQFNRLLHNLTFFAYLPGGICHGEEFRPFQWRQDHIRKGSADRKLHLLKSYELIRRDRALKMN